MSASADAKDSSVSNDSKPSKESRASNFSKFLKDSNGSEESRGGRDLARLFAGLRAERRTGLSIYLMSGDPSREKCVDYFRAAIRGGADWLEIGVPFSDPVADGPTIQRAGVRALAGGAKLDDALALTRTLAKEFPGTPLVLMTYANIAYKRGWSEFARLAREAGAAGVILPDAPLEESDEPRAAFEAAGLELVQLASPASSPERLARLGDATRGFLYLVSTYGVTGARASLPPEVSALVARAKAATKAPIAVGFGVSEPAHVRALRAAGADAVIVGSATVSFVERGEAPAKLEAFVRSLKEATRS
ncbi:MAG: tryptophan synthase subunit alpha [Thermoplasmatota archaeon]